MIILTGAAGFIGSCMLTQLNQAGYSRDVVVVDDFYKYEKDKNTHNKVVREWMHRDIFLDWFETTHQDIDFVIHLGARTDTTSQDLPIFENLNLRYSKRIWNVCVRKSIPLIYASSAATYGSGDTGFDDELGIDQLKPLNPYAESKQQFDVWATAQKDTPPYWVGCKFFNVYGPNEYHKGRMASVIYHTYNQIQSTGEMRLFKSHNPAYLDGHQSRDFIYVKDILNLLTFFMAQKGQVESGIYNFGTGKSRTFLDLSLATFKAMGVEPKISYIDTPLDIRESYQYFTEATTEKLRKSGYHGKFSTLEDGIDDYIKGYLIHKRYL